MKLITVYGASDDLVEVEGCEGADEFNVYAPNPIIWRADLVTRDEGMRIHAINSDGCWQFAIGQVDASVPFPDWPLSIIQHPQIEHSTLLAVEAPDDVRLTGVKTEGPW